jgi:hypothetical protein
MDHPGIDASVLQTPGARQMAAWTLRLMADDLFCGLFFSDAHLFALGYASCATAVDPPEQLRPSSSSIRTDAGGRLLSTLKDMQRQYGLDVSGRFAGLYLDALDILEQGRDREQLLAAFDQWRSLAEQEVASYISPQEQNVDRVAGLLELTTAERRLLSFALNRTRPGFEQLIDSLLGSETTTSVILGRMFDVGIAEVLDAISEQSELVRSGLVSIEYRPLRINAPSHHLRSVFNEPADSDEEFASRFLRELAPSPSTGSLARLDERDRDILLRLMRLPLPEEGGLHALVYGSRSIDKTDMLARLFSEADIPAYVATVKSVPASDLPAWIAIGQRILERTDPQAVFVIPRADQALVSRRINVMTLLGLEEEAPDLDFEERISDEGLIGARLRCVWLTDRGNLISERNLGHFLFHCEAKPGSRADRRQRIEQIMSEFSLSEELERHLAKYSLLGEQQVRQAVKLASLVADEADQREQIIRRAVQQSQRVLKREHLEELRDSVTHYSLENLNVAGRFTPEQILQALRRRPVGTIALYGLPGAGKSAWAEFVAVEIDRPLMMRRASDLLSKWLGESEQNIAAMFAEAEAEGALLFLDEADSFLRDRSLARAEWSVTQVNEILQQMERFPGVFIAATNLMRDIDAAALRRFTWKLEFLPLRPEQAWRMFLTETGFDERAEADRGRAEELKRRLLEIENLTPGDFATVKRQALMLGDELDPEAWIEQLAVEAKAKMLGIERNKIGFTAD